MLYALLGLLVFSTPVQAVELTVKIQGAVVHGGLFVSHNMILVRC